LQADGRATYDQIAEAVGLSPSAVLRRVKRLEESGVIDRYVALVKPERWVWG
jgi:Lrp/AsnC family leucine-responsive transcriptional regulator